MPLRERSLPSGMKMSVFRERVMRREEWLRGKKKWLVVGFVPLVLVIVLVLVLIEWMLKSNETYNLLKYCTGGRVRRGSSEIVIGNGECDGYVWSVLDMSVYRGLKRLEIGGYNFKNVRELRLIGLSELESVEIGRYSFTKYKSTYQITPDPNRHFYLKNCPKLKSLKMGNYSFSDYTVIEIENVDALEVIEIGDLHEKSYNFCIASLELKSILIHSE